MSKVIGVNSDNDSLDLDTAKAKPAPFVSTSLVIELYKHTDSGKQWAISQCGTHGFSNSARSFGTWMHFEYSGNKSKLDRIKEKTLAGYVCEGDYTFDHISRMPEKIPF